MNIEEIVRNELTEHQKSAVVDPNTEILCLACAGSGKSRTLAYRIARLLASGEQPDSIVAFTFTIKAAETIKRRVAESLLKAGITTNIMGAMYIGTIHSYCKYILDKMNPIYRQYDVLDDNKFILYLVSRYNQLGLSALRNRARGNSYFDCIRRVAEAWKTMNDEGIEIEQITDADELLGETLSMLKESLNDDQFIDFSQIIKSVVKALQEGDSLSRSAVSNLKHLLVDEYQDVSPSEEELIRQLHQLSETLFVVGDDDQSIFAWRGADVSNILNFHSQYIGSNSHTLSVNFRSTPAIVEAAENFAAAELGASRIAKSPSAHANKSPHDYRVLWFDNRQQEVRWIAERISALIGTRFEEADETMRGLTPADFAILMRSTRESEQDGTPRHHAYTQALAERDIRFSLEAGGGPFEREEVQVLLQAFELLRDRSPSRQDVRRFFEATVSQVYRSASLDSLVRVFTDWGRRVHAPSGGARRRVYPQQLVYDLLESFGLRYTHLHDEVMRDIGLFSRIIQDVESVYMSVDSPSRFHEILNFLSNVAESGYDISTEDVLQRPDAVTVSTVHKAKGLEFPVVFVVDIEGLRFPGSNRGYKGWLPETLIRPALDRGAYQRNDNEEARLFYTAITRAERYLYISGAEHLPGGVRRRARSRFANRLTHAEISNSPDGLPDGILNIPQRRRIDETILPTSFSQIRYYLRCPMDYRFRQGFGFSPPIPDMFGFGQTVHTAVAKLHSDFVQSPPEPEEAQAVADGVFHLKHVPKSRNPEENPGPYERAKAKSIQIVKEYASSYHDDFIRSRQVEARFEVPAKDCVISGAIDLLLKEDREGKILDAEVIDFKAIETSDDIEKDDDLDWTEFSLQIQLYALAAKEVLGENARTGSVHLLKRNLRVAVPVSEEAVKAAILNVEWAVQGIISADFPMRPHVDKCLKCDFQRLCSQIPQDFRSDEYSPPRIHIPGGEEFIRAFSNFDSDHTPNG